MVVETAGTDVPGPGRRGKEPAPRTSRVTGTLAPQGYSGTLGPGVVGVGWTAPISSDNDPDTLFSLYNYFTYSYDPRTTLCTCSFVVVNFY